MDKKQIYEQLAQQIIDSLKDAEKLGKWVKPWSSDELRPTNPITGTKYTGCNRLILATAKSRNGFSCNYWATFKQLESVGASVKKGSKGCHCLFYKQASKENQETGETDFFPVLSSFVVFNADQTDNFPMPEIADRPVKERVSAAEKFFQMIQYDSEIDENAWYSPSRDVVGMPAFESFCSAEGYYSVLAHELAHWTGHKSRLDRENKNKFGSSKYAFEELIAELSSCFTCADLGLESEPKPEHCQYIKSWLEALENDPKHILTAASMAQKASEYLQQQAK